MKRLLLLGASTVLALAAAEVCLTLLGLPAPIGQIDFFDEGLGDTSVFAPDEELFWRLRPDTKRYLTNEVGFRGRWPSREKEPGDLRIACVGDSCTFGTEVRYESSWGKRLERLLQARFPHRFVESIVAGMPGHSLFQSTKAFEQLVLPLRPDVTVVYAGAWNDYSDAIERNDPDTYRELHSPTPRTWRMLRELAGPPTGSGPRVPLEDFRACLRQLIGQARAAESRVFVVLPPLPASTYEQFPLALEYRAALEATCRSEQVETLDGTALFEPHLANVREWVPALDGRWPVFQDRVHPTAFGYDLLARALAERIGPWFEDAAPRPSDLRVDTAEWSGTSLLVRGLGFKSTPIDRAHWGDWWLPQLEVLDDTALRVGGWTYFPPGTAPLELSGPGGVLASTAPIALAAPELHAELLPEAEGSTLQVTADLRPGDAVYLFLSGELRAEPAATRYGEFRLAATPDGRPPGLETGTFEFLRLKLMSVDGRCDEQGHFLWRTRLDLAKLPEVPDSIHVQALVADAHRSEYAVLTPVVSVALKL